MNLYFVMYYIFLHADPYDKVGKIQKKKEKKTKHIHRRLIHNYILIKKERKKHIPVLSSLFT